MQHLYRGTEGTIKNLNTFFYIINLTINLTVVTVDSMLAQWSMLVKLLNPWLLNCQINACTTVKSTLVQPLNQRLWNHPIDACTTVESTLKQATFLILLYFLFNLLSTAISQLSKLLHKHASAKKLYISSK